MLKAYPTRDFALKETINFIFYKPIFLFSLVNMPISSTTNFTSLEVEFVFHSFSLFICF